MEDEMFMLGTEEPIREATFFCFLFSRGEYEVYKHMIFHTPFTCVCFLSIQSCSLTSPVFM